MTKSKMTIIAISLFIVLLVVGVFYFWNIVLSKAPNSGLATGKISINGNTFAVEIATTTIEQARGLSFRTTLAEGSGMLFLFRPAIQNFWMKDMNFPIDIIWIAGNEVVGFVQDAKPQPGASLWELTIYNSPDNVDKVLEVNAGVVAKDGIAVGSPVVFEQGVSGQ